ncbi:MAG: hypothetical protein AAFO29_22640, partial [Actinomycetota bacterium]
MSTVEFSIPTTDSGYVSGSPSYWTIAPTGTHLGSMQLDLLDATTQPGWTNQPIVQLDGSNFSGSEDGVHVDLSGMTVKGLSITNWPDDGAHTSQDDVTFSANWFGVTPTGAVGANASGDLVLYGGADGVTVGGNAAADGNVFGAGGPDDGVLLTQFVTATDIANNRFGIGADGTTDLGAVAEGITVWEGTSTTIRDNVFGHFPNSAIAQGTSSTGTVITGNTFGLDDASGAAPIGNALWNDSSGTIRFGGTGAGEGNTVANATWNGVQAESTATGNIAILGNSFVDSAQLAIDLNNDGVTANDAGDGDTGPNDLLNFPVITGASESGGTVTADFDLDVPAGNYRIEFFTNPSGVDSSGNGEGETFVHAESITHTGSGSESFSASFTGSAGDVVTSTATVDLGGGSYGATSEFS